MITLDLRTQHFTPDELFQAAASEAVHVIAKDGTVFVLEPADEFEREVTQLGQSHEPQRLKLRGLSLARRLCRLRDVRLHDGSPTEHTYVLGSDCVSMTSAAT
jgi:hypothetical protein